MDKGVFKCMLFAVILWAEVSKNDAFAKVLYPLSHEAEWQLPAKIGNTSITLSSATSTTIAKKNSSTTITITKKSTHSASTTATSSLTTASNSSNPTKGSSTPTAKPFAKQAWFYVIIAVVVILVLSVGGFVAYKFRHVWKRFLCREKSYSTSDNNHQQQPFPVQAEMKQSSIDEDINIAELMEKKGRAMQGPVPTTEL